MRLPVYLKCRKSCNKKQYCSIYYNIEICAEFRLLALPKSLHPSSLCWLLQKAIQEPLLDFSEYEIFASKQTFSSNMSGHRLVQSFVASTDNQTLLTIIPCKAATTIWGIPLILKDLEQCCCHSISSTAKTKIHKIG